MDDFSSERECRAAIDAAVADENTSTLVLSVNVAVNPVRRINLLRQLIDDAETEICQARTAQAAVMMDAQGGMGGAGSSLEDSLRFMGRRTVGGTPSAAAAAARALSAAAAGGGPPGTPGGGVYGDGEYNVDGYHDDGFGYGGEDPFYGDDPMDLDVPVRSKALVVVILLHVPPARMVDQGSSVYPALFLDGWSFEYLDTISGGDTRREPIATEAWLRVGCRLAGGGGGSDDDRVDTGGEALPGLAAAFDSFRADAIAHAVARIDIGENVSLAAANGGSSDAMARFYSPTAPPGQRAHDLTLVGFCGAWHRG